MKGQRKLFDLETEEAVSLAIERWELGSQCECMYSYRHISFLDSQPPSMCYTFMCFNNPRALLCTTSESCFPCVIKILPPLPRNYIPNMSFARPSSLAYYYSKDETSIALIDYKNNKCMTVMFCLYSTH